MAAPDTGPRYCGRKEFSSKRFTKKEQSPLLRHGLVFLRGRLTLIGRHAIPKVKREGSVVS